MLQDNQIFATGGSTTCEEESRNNSEMKNSQNRELIDAYLREANVFGEWKSTNGFADPLLNPPGAFAWLDEISKDDIKFDPYVPERCQ